MCMSVCACVGTKGAARLVNWLITVHLAFGSCYFHCLKIALWVEIAERNWPCVPRYQTHRDAVSGTSRRERERECVCVCVCVQGAKALTPSLTPSLKQAYGNLNTLRLTDSHYLRNQFFEGMTSLRTLSFTNCQFASAVFVSRRRPQRVVTLLQVFIPSAVALQRLQGAANSITEDSSNLNTCNTHAVPLCPPSLCPSVCLSGTHTLCLPLCLSHSLAV